ncbi:MAG TPA: hypothetical protein VMX96_03550 [Dehalococcoidia bacterium]|nr:hypothetical protein [Dehalococcoidia bacterium]
MQVTEIYEEIIPFSLMKLVLGVFIALTILFLGLFVYQVLVGPVSANPAPDWFYLIMFVLFAGFTALIRNFNKLAIKVSTQSVTVGFGIFKRVVSWDDIHGCYLDDASAFGSYGGWGIRTAKVKGKWRLVYNVIGSPTVVLELKRGRFREFVFSTKNPDGIMEIARKQIR